MRRYFWIAILLVIAAMMLCGCDPPDPTPAPTVAPMEQPAAPVESAALVLYELYVDPLGGEDCHGTICGGSKDDALQSIAGAYEVHQLFAETGLSTLSTDVYVSHEEREGEWEFFCSFGQGASSPPSVWIDQVNGDDGTGDGTPISPFKSLTRAYHFLETSDLELIEAFVKEVTGWEYYGTWLHPSIKPIPPIGGGGK